LRMQCLQECRKTLGELDLLKGKRREPPKAGKPTYQRPTPQG
jgi:hypothetical protein